MPIILAPHGCALRRNRHAWRDGMQQTTGDVCGPVPRTARTCRYCGEEEGSLLWILTSPIPDHILAGVLWELTGKWSGGLDLPHELMHAFRDAVRDGYFRPEELDYIVARMAALVPLCARVTRGDRAAEKQLNDALLGDLGLYALVRSGGFTAEVLRTGGAMPYLLEIRGILSPLWVTFRQVAFPTLHYEVGIVDERTAHDWLWHYDRALASGVASALARDLNVPLSDRPAVVSAPDGLDLAMWLPWRRYPPA
jgi:hypothetical protein